MRTAVRIESFTNNFICYVRDLYDTICEYISREWIETKEESVRAFATNHDIDEKTARRIRDWKTTHYRITLTTLEKICLSRDITLEEFFRKIKR
jgi:hypothetical protein